MEKLKYVALSTKSVLDNHHSLGKIPSGVAVSSNPVTPTMADEHIPHRELKQIQIQILAGLLICQSR